jgi:O-antigen ligase
MSSPPEERTGAGIADRRLQIADCPRQSAVCDLQSAICNPCRERWLTLLCVTLLGYAVLGKGWAYVGVPPVFLGEVVLFSGLLSLLLYGRWRALLDLPAAWLLLVLGAWGLARTWPDLGRYGADALRDAVLWGYSAFALVVFGAVAARPTRLPLLLRRYGQFARIFVAAVPVVWLAYRFFGDAVPRWPWADVPVLLPKGGDLLVHSAGVLAFWVAGLGGPVGRLPVLWLAGSVLLVGTYDRAGLLSFLAAFALCAFLKPHDRALRRLLLLGLGGLAVLALLDVRVRMPGREREVSFAQFTANLASLVGVAHAGDLDDTKQWRLEWWRDIYGYTVEGKYFWTGKGFGINLADDDGYQVEEDGSLRSPHNGHLTMLARGGVPGLALWLLVQLSWSCGVLGGYLRSRRAGDERWANLFLFLLAYWTAFMVNATFDVFLEGPMGGIWFWTVYGVGLAAVWLYRHDPGVLPAVGTA